MGYEGGPARMRHSVANSRIISAIDAPGVGQGTFPDARVARHHLLMLQAITLQITANWTLDSPRTRSLLISFPLFSSDMVASAPERILYASFHSSVCCFTNISSLRCSSGVISNRKLPVVSRGRFPFFRRQNHVQFSQELLLNTGIAEFGHRMNLNVNR